MSEQATKTDLTFLDEKLDAILFKITGSLDESEKLIKEVKAIKVERFKERQRYSQ